MGGGKGSNDEFSKDTGEGLEEITDEKEAALKAALGEDYDKLYGN